MRKFLRTLYLTKRFFDILFVMAVSFVMAFFVPGLLGVLKFLFLVLLGLVAVDLYLLYRTKNGLQVKRTLPEKLSNGDNNDIYIDALNNYGFKLRIRLIDELPIQWQRRDFEITGHMDPGSHKQFTYQVRPTERGEYHFGNLSCVAKYINSLGALNKIIQMVRYFTSKTRG